MEIFGLRNEELEIGRIENMRMEILRIGITDLFWDRQKEC